MPLSPFTPKQRDTLVVALLVNDLVGALNQAMRVRKILLTLDYTHKDHRLRLYAERPLTPREVWMITNTRTKVCTACRMADPHLQLFVNDATERLAKLGGTLTLVGGKRHHTAPEAKVQLAVDGAANTALTLARAHRGREIRLTHFVTPDGTTPGYSTT